MGLADGDGVGDSVEGAKEGLVLGATLGAKYFFTAIRASVASTSTHSESGVSCATTVTFECPSL